MTLLLQVAAELGELGDLEHEYRRTVHKMAEELRAISYTNGTGG